MSRRASLLALFAVVVSCSQGGNESPLGEPAEGKREAPLTAASIEGRVTNVVRSGETSGSITVETRPEESAGSPKARLRIEQSTLIVLRGMQRGDFNSLDPGQWVRVWFTGPVMESYPVQARASTVVVDSLSPSGR